MMPPSEQARVLLAMILCGAAIGAAYDAVSALRLMLLRAPAAQAAQDLLFGAVSAAGIAGAALLLRTDAFRWYTLLGALAGVGLYRASLGALWRRLGGMVAGHREKLAQKEREKAR